MRNCWCNLSDHHRSITRVVSPVLHQVLRLNISHAQTSVTPQTSQSPAPQPTDSPPSPRSQPISSPISRSWTALAPPPVRTRAVARRLLAPVLPLPVPGRVPTPNLRGQTDRDLEPHHVATVAGPMPPAAPGHLRDRALGRALALFPVRAAELGVVARRGAEALNSKAPRYSSLSQFLQFPYARHRQRYADAHISTDCNRKTHQECHGAPHPRNLR